VLKCPSSGIFWHLMAATGSMSTFSVFSVILRLVHFVFELSFVLHKSRHSVHIRICSCIKIDAADSEFHFCTVNTACFDLQFNRYYCIENA